MYHPTKPEIPCEQHNPNMTNKTNDPKNTQAKRKPKGLLNKLLEDTPPGRALVFSQTEKMVAKNAGAWVLYVYGGWGCSGFACLDGRIKEQRDGWMDERMNSPLSDAYPPPKPTIQGGTTPRPWRSSTRSSTASTTASPRYVDRYTQTGLVSFLSFGGEVVDSTILYHTYIT